MGSLASRQVRLARDAGALDRASARAARTAPAWHLHAGEFDGAAALIDEAEAITEATGNAPLMYTSLVLAAWRGRRGRGARADRRQRSTTRPRRARAGRSPWPSYATAVLYNGLGRYQAALAAARRACEHDELGLFGWALVELVEAAARSGEPELAADALEQLVERTRAERHRLGARGRGAFARAAERRRRGGGALPRGDRAARPHPDRGRSSPART